MKKHKKIIMAIVKSLLAGIGVLLFLIGVGWFYVSSIMQPPEIPVHEADDSSTPAYVSAEDALGEYKIDDVPPIPLIHSEERKPLFFTFLIFGLDDGLNADTIMVGAYDGEARQGYIISIPRDTRVDVQRNLQKINSAYAVGRISGRGHEGGVDRLKYEVSTLIGFRPDFYIGVDYKAFIRMVDTVGGVEVSVPFNMIYDDPAQDLHINIPAGLQVLDGQNAMHFAKYRLGNNSRYTISDYQRIENQQQILAAMFAELLTPAAIIKIPEFIRIFNDHVDSDLAMGELLWFANEARLIRGTDALQLFTLPMLGTSGTPQWYELPNQKEVLELINRTINPFIRGITAEDLRIVR
jgi:LCP family protein required for cell wall assembly